MSNKINWENISKEFPINEEYIWMNSAGVSAPHSSFLRDVRSALDQYSKSIYFASDFNYDKMKKNIKRYLAKMLKCDPDEVTPIHNTAEGMNFAAHGIQLNSGDEIILLENEYPSNVYPWFSLKKKNIKIIFIPVLEDESKFLDLLEKKITNKTKIISMSAVYWLTGMPLPLKKIGKLCKKNKIIFVVDSAQGLGHIKLHPKEYNISFLCGSAWKWLLGPLGLGYLYIAEDFLESVEPIFWGTDSVIDSGNYLPYKNKWKVGTDRFSYSSTSYFDWVYFCSALHFLDTIGFDLVRERICFLANLLKEKLIGAGFQVLNNYNSPSKSTGIVTIKHLKISSHKINNFLEKKKIITALRNDSVRLSTHLMNTEDQISKCVDLLSKASF